MFRFRRSQGSWAGIDSGAVVRFLAYTGMRWGEMSALQVQDVNVARPEATITRAVTEVNGVMGEGNPKTGESRTVPLPQFIADSLAIRMRGSLRVIWCSPLATVRCCVIQRLGIGSLSRQWPGVRRMI